MAQCPRHRDCHRGARRDNRAHHESYELPSVAYAVAPPAGDKSAVVGRYEENWNDER